MKLLTLFVSSILVVACLTSNKTAEPQLNPEDAELYIANIYPWEAKLPHLNKYSSLLGGGLVVNNDHIISSKVALGNYEKLVGRPLTWVRMEQTVDELDRDGATQAYSIRYSLNGTWKSRTLHWESGRLRLE